MAEPTSNKKFWRQVNLKVEETELVKKSTPSLLRRAIFLLVAFPLVVSSAECAGRFIRHIKIRREWNSLIQAAEAEGKHDIAETLRKWRKEGGYLDK